MRLLKESVADIEFLLKEWDYEKNELNTIYPDKISSQANRKVWWKCKYGHHWEAKVNNRYNGRGCPICSKYLHTSFPEQALFYYIKQVFPLAINGYKEIFKHGMELDIYIPELKLGIEYDGCAWHTKKSLVKETKKYEICKSNGILLWKVLELSEDYSNGATSDKIFFFNDRNYLSDKFSSLIFEVLKEIADLPNNSNLSLPIIDVYKDEYRIRESVNAFREGSLETNFPEIAKSWDFSKNGNLYPSMFSCHSSQKFWWKCEKGHSWKAAITVRTRGNNCPYCAGQKVMPGFNDLNTLYPDVVKEWDYEFNKPKIPEMFTGGSGIKVGWICAKGHRWITAINNRTVNKRGCPYCAHKKTLSGENDLETLYPEIAKDWHPTFNGSRLPNQFLPFSNVNCWWKCSVCGWEYKTSINNRVKQNTGCPDCAGHILHSGKNDLETHFPELSAEWDYEKNGDLKPNQVFPFSNKPVWWIDKLGHSWRTSPSNRINGKRCPYCSGNKVLIGFNDLNTTNPDLAKDWHPTKNGDLVPTMVSRGYTKKVWWLCSKCGNEFEAYVTNRRKGYGCKECKSKLKSIGLWE